MISVEDFKKGWKENLVSYSEEEITSSSMNESNKSFLIESGLPDSCAPFLGFNEKSHSSELLNIKKSLELNKEDFINQYVIGGDGSGNLIVVDGDDNRIKVFDHEYISEVDQEGELDFHEEFIPIQFMNSSVSHLAHCLLVYKHFVNSIRSVRNDRSFLEIEPTSVEIEELRNNLQFADDKCLEEKSFWWFELEDLKQSH